jgi:hypothetical protein
MTELSPAAQAVLRAAGDSEPGIYATIAAALRAAADQVVSEVYTEACDCCLVIMQEIRHQLLAIAAEMEAK